MELPDDTPRLPKIPFIIGDLILLSIAALLAYRMGTEPTTAEVVGIVVSTGLAVAVGLAPFVIGYARDQDQMLRDRERLLERLVRETSSASDQASIAASGLNEIAEKTKANLASLDELPASIQAARDAAEAKSAKSKSSELKRLENEMTAIRDELATQGKSLNDRIDKATASMEESVQSLVPLIRETAALSAAKPPTSPTPNKAKGRTKKTKAPAPVAQDSLFGGEVAPTEPLEVKQTAPIIAEPDIPQKKKPRSNKSKAQPEDINETEAAITDEKQVDAEHPQSEAPVDAISAGEDNSGEDLILPPEPDSASTDEAPAIEPETPSHEDTLPEPTEAAPLESEPVAAEESEIDESTVLDEPAPEEPALSSDGMTRLTVTAYIGIGNRLFIRGDGPGLSREEGVPLQFVSIGKWRWESDSASAPVKATLWKNDEEECTSLGEIKLAPGAQMETSANF